MSNMNFIPVDTDLDNLLDQMLLQQNPQHLADLERQRNDRLEGIRAEQEATDGMLFTEENKRNVEDIRQLNQINLAEILPEKVAKKPDDSAIQEESKEESKSAEKQAEASKLEIITTTSDSAQAATQQTKLDYMD